ncbi:hypothetical protein OS493_028807 [Desmophyllum pertusum]|uniref:GCF C-terminal domain-containing protein n=1 Tax=Desmophyllum pertusum TaxID=174260 RepID=A0A9W9ZXT4_9CNID|nr:hypothetical protein OS493_028807 [Desmophyllum pertusum]
MFVTSSKEEDWVMKPGQRSWKGWTGHRVSGWEAYKREGRGALVVMVQKEPRKTSGVKTFIMTKGRRRLLGAPKKGPSISLKHSKIKVLTCWTSNQDPNRFMAPLANNMPSQEKNRHRYKQTDIVDSSHCHQMTIALNTDKCEEIFNTLQEEYYEEFKIMSRWREILQRKEAENSAFTLTLSQGVAHGKKIHGIVETVTQCLSLINVWTPVFPQWITDNIKQQLILPRLQAEVDAWNPLTDTVPVHAWIHPWLPLMGTFSTGNSFGPFLGDHLEPLFAPIRFKLASALTNWHPSDPSAKMILEPWTKVLRGWLSVSPNYDEVIQWYSGWKGMFSEDLLNNPSVKVQFNRALDVMNQAVTSPGGLLQPGAKENIAYLTSTERRREAEAAAMAAAVEKQKAEAARNVAASQNVPSNFKDLIQNLAEENNLLFMPIPNRRFEGKALYSLVK